jgi:hypothetical protein
MPNTKPTISKLKDLIELIQDLDLSALLDLIRQIGKTYRLFSALDWSDYDAFVEARDAAIETMAMLVEFTEIETDDRIVQFVGAVLESPAASQMLFELLGRWLSDNMVTLETFAADVMKLTSPDE